MSIRICQSFNGKRTAFPWKVLRLASICSLTAMQASANGFNVHYAPQVVFRGDPLAFQLRADERGQASLHAGDRLLATVPLVPGEMGEVSFNPNRGKFLRFSLEEAEHQFRLLQPTENIEGFSERDGYLEINDLPVILMPDHRKPPPLDRRWETMGRLAQRLRDQRPPLDKILWLAPNDSTAPDSLGKTLSSGKITRSPPAPEAWFELHGFLLAPLTTDAADFVVVEVDASDFERGMPANDWLMKWQFALQRVQHKSGAKQGLLLGPEPGPGVDPWMPWFKENLPALANAHGLIFVDRSLPEPVWRERIIHRLDRNFLLP
ncbi:MAG: hypothetical protein JJU29_11305 [Verrucomicrobia bacterium]|nr:hypothetical protein [Verrucomicrobiota bacterium]MCH8512999.1 hypothetical protein [Kiritimatiellia bacterium]